MDERQAFAAALWSLEIIDYNVREEIISQDVADYAIREIKIHCVPEEN